jgi:hypothetical protein
MMMSAQHKSQDTEYNRPTRFDRYLQQQYADWFRKAFHWNLFATFTFSNDLSSNEANRRLGSYLRLIEEEVGSSLACLIAEERNYSGLGQARERIHFHLQIQCSRPLDTVRFTELWKEDRFGGDRTVGPSAEVRVYDENLSAAYYMFKHLHDPTWDWSHWRLAGASKRTPKSFATSKETRRMWRRQQERAQRYAA